VLSAYEAGRCCDFHHPKGTRRQSVANPPLIALRDQTFAPAVMVFNFARVSHNKVAMRVDDYVTGKRWKFRFMEKAASTTRITACTTTRNNTSIPTWMLQTHTWVKSPLFRTFDRAQALRPLRPLARRPARVAWRPSTVPNIRGPPRLPYLSGRRESQTRYLRSGRVEVAYRNTSGTVGSPLTTGLYDRRDDGCRWMKWRSVII